MLLESTQVTKEALQMARGYADAVLMGPLNQIGGVLSDTLGYWRLKNQIRLLLKSREWLEERGVEPIKVLPDIFVPLIEQGGNVEDPTLADMFASLLASHLDPDSQDRVHPSFANVLGQLSPLDARMMIEFRKLASDPQYRKLGLRGAPMTVAFAAERLDISEDASFLSCLNLSRLGVVRHDGTFPPKGHPWPEVFEDDRDHQQYKVTEYGVALCDACQYKEAASSPTAEVGLKE